jgi:hypothetical protein
MAALFNFGICTPYLFQGTIWDFFVKGQQRQLIKLQCVGPPAQSLQIYSGRFGQTLGGAAVHPKSITGSRPISRASERSRFSTRSPASAARSPLSRNASLCRSTASEVWGSTPGIAAETT